MSEEIRQEAYSTSFEFLTDLESYVGKELGISPWIEISQERINTFADATEDQQWIHVDVERSKKESPYKQPIAHGFLVLSMASKFTYDTYGVADVVMGVNYGLNKVRFISATPAGAKLRGRVSLANFEMLPNGKGAKYMVNVVFEIEGEEKPACVAEFLAQAYTES